MGLTIALGVGVTSTLVVTAGSWTVGSILRASGLAVSGTSPISYSVQWYRDDVAIPGAISTTYDTSGEVAGAMLHVEVTSAEGTLQSPAVTLLAAAPAPAPAGTVTLNAMAQQPAFFDSGAARGVNAASIPLSGTTDASDGTNIEARLVRADTGAEVAPWVVVGTASAGVWNGTYFGAQRSAHRLHAEVRIAEAASNTARGNDDIIIGHILVLIGQSEEAYMMSPSTDTNTLQAQRPAILDPDALHLITYRSGGDYPGSDYASNGILQITDAAMYHTAMGYMSNFLAENAPGERFLLLDAAVSGTSYWNLASDDPAAHASGEDRTWQGSFKGGLDLIRSYGAEPGVLMSTWTAAPAVTGDGYRRRLYPLFTGRYAPEQGGGDYVLGTDPINNRPYDYLFYDLTGQGRGALNPAITKAYFYGPHRFELTETNETKQDTRASIRNFVDDGIGHILGFVGPEIISYESGFQAVGSSYEADRSIAENWKDYTHPSKVSADGSPRRAQFTALSALYGLGIGPSAAQSQDVPEFNRAYWEPSGAYAEFWYEDSLGATPAISTTRLERAASAMPSTLNGTGSSSETAIGGAPLPHRTDVVGFEINGEAAETVSIVNGRVRVYPNAGSLDGNSRIDFGRGGASGIHSVQGLSSSDVIQADLFDKIWMNMPIATGLVSGVEGIALRPMPLQSDIESTLAAAPRFTVSGTTAIYDQNNWGANTPITLKFRLIATPASGNEEALVRLPTSSTELKLSLLNDTNVRYKFASGGVSTTTVEPALPYANVMREFVITADPNSGAFGVYLDGVEITRQASGATNGFSGSYGLRLLGLSTGSSLLNAEIESITIWDAYTADGTDPASAPYKTISGNAGAALAAAKAGPNPFTWYEEGIAQ